MFILSLTGPLYPSLFLSVSPWVAFDDFMPLTCLLSSGGADTWVELAPSLLVVPFPLSSLLLPRDPSPFYRSSGLVLPRDTAREEGHLLHHPHGCPRLRVLGDRPSGLLWEGTCPPATPTLQTGTEPDTPASSPTMSLGVNPTCNPHHVPIQEVP